METLTLSSADEISASGGSGAVTGDASVDAAGERRGEGAGVSAAIMGARAGAGGRDAMGGTIDDGRGVATRDWGADATDRTGVTGAEGAGNRGGVAGSVSAADHSDVGVGAGSHGSTGEEVGDALGDANCCGGQSPPHPPGGDSISSGSSSTRTLARSSSSSSASRSRSPAHPSRHRFEVMPPWQPSVLSTVPLAHNSSPITALHLSQSTSPNSVRGAPGLSSSAESSMLAHVGW
jgi:hypothetical protein